MENPEKSQNKGDEHGRRLRTPSGGIGMPWKRAGRAGDSGMHAHSDRRTEQGDVSSGGVVSSDVISTVTVSSAFMPLVVFAVIFAVPFVLAVTRPVSSMVITSGWSVSHVMVLSVVFSGRISALSCTV